MTEVVGTGARRGLQRVKKELFQRHEVMAGSKVYSNIFLLAYGAITCLKFNLKKTFISFQYTLNSGNVQITISLPYLDLKLILLV